MSEGSRFQDGAANVEHRSSEDNTLNELSTVKKELPDAVFYKVFPAIFFVFCGLSVLGVMWVAFFVGAAFWGNPESSLCLEDVRHCKAILEASSPFFFELFFPVARAVLYGFCGMAIQRRRYYQPCRIAAGLLCLDIPLGTVLGIFTLSFLGRATVQEAFRRTNFHWAGSGEGMFRSKGDDDYKRPEIIRKG